MNETMQRYFLFPGLFDKKRLQEVAIATTTLSAIAAREAKQIDDKPPVPVERFANVSDRGELLGEFVLEQTTYVVNREVKPVFAFTPTPLPAIEETPTPEPTKTPTPKPVDQVTFKPQSIKPVIPEYTIWDDLAQCESTGNWAANTGNGYFGGLQFDLPTWDSLGGQGNPANASREEQIRIAQILHTQRGFQPWPGCQRLLGLP